MSQGFYFNKSSFLRISWKNTKYSQFWSNSSNTIFWIFGIQSYPSVLYGIYQWRQVVCKQWKVSSKAESIICLVGLLMTIKHTFLWEQQLITPQWVSLGISFFLFFHVPLEVVQEQLKLFSGQEFTLPANREESQRITREQNGEIRKYERFIIIS